MIDPLIVLRGMMVNSVSENETSHSRLKSADELTPKKSLRYKHVDEISPKDMDTHVQSPTNNTTKSFENINTVTLKACVITSKSQLEDKLKKMSDFKLNIKRIDETNYVSMLSPRSLKMIGDKSHDDKSPNNLCSPITPKKNSRKFLRWSERNENNVLNLVEELMEDSDNEDKMLNIAKERAQDISVFSNCSDKSNNKDDKLVSIIPKRTRNTPRSSSTSSKSIDTDDILQCVTPKRTRKPVNRFGESMDSSEIKSPNTPSKNKRKRKTSVSLCTPVKSSNVVDDISECISPKRTRKTSVSLFTPSKSNNVNLLESITPKRIRKSVNRFGESVDWNDIEITNKTPESTKKNGKISIEDDDTDFKFDVWKTPVNKRLRQSMTPTTHSGSKTRRSILQNIPEDKEIVSSPKTPKKTPKAHVKHLTASASRRLDSGARVPCSPVEKARANLHLNAAPKHLPCREVEFKSIHSFLSRKINDELTGSMYISGVPGTGKTATVKRVIDSLNCDLLMKHSFKFIEINGLRLANPHQAFSVIWKELTAETVSSSRAQTLLNDYFSGNEVRELSTILLVDEVDHICNRKQDVVYNILDWPSRTGSKVVVITIANTMDLPERVLRGCVTSRMGLTRLVFKPYTFQQLQEIIMNRLIGNSLFDPDAVQLVARKVAAISGDARRALDICRRAIDLIKCEETEFVTINHVNEVINSILSGVRVTAIRNCSLLEQFFLRALRDETTRTGFDHCTIDSVYIQMKSICLFEGEELPNDQQVIMMAYRLRDSGLLFLEKKRLDIFRKVSLNVSPEDISYALENNNIEVNQ